VFEENFVRRAEIGASVCVWMDGEKVVDLWGGLADFPAARPWEEDTLGFLFSSTKGLTALAMLMLADRGKLDHDARVAEYWPEFAQNGKERITVRQLLNHRSGLSAIDHPLSLDDLEDSARVAPALEAQEPLWEPGTAQGYGGVSFGAYVAELFRRIEGRSIGRFLADEVAGPLGVDVHLGLPAELDARVATVVLPRRRDRILRMVPRLIWGRGVEGRVFRAFADKTSATARAFANPADLGPRGLHNVNTPRVRQMELPWMNGITNARSLASVYAALTNVHPSGVRLVAPELLEEVQRRQSWQVDRVLRKPMGFSLGFVKEESHLFSPYSEAFGHPGAGGCVGFADPPRRLAFGYVMNRMDWRLRSPRCLALCHAAYGCL
jgi:CubicO group peptidase (beta-lactamase class C family)